MDRTLQMTLSALESQEWVGNGEILSCVNASEFILVALGL